MSNQTNSHVVEELQKVLADTYSLYFKTHSYHWNVEGMHFHTLHAMFEEHYTEMWQAIDVLAERLRALGAYAPANYDEMVTGSRIAKDKTVPDASTMVKNLTQGHETLIDTLHNALSVAQKEEDEVSADAVLARLEVHEKTLWMLKSLSK